MRWILAFHLFFSIGWFAGIFYLPRLFVHHCLSEDAATRRRLSIMQRNLYRFMSLLACFAVALGLAMTALGWERYATFGWFWAKLALVAALIAYHLVCGHYVAVLGAGESRRGHAFFRWFNELPAVLLLGIVALAVVRPF